jgi:hypothetical protein
MRLALYNIIYSIIRLKQHCPLQKNIALMQHTLPSEFSTPRSRVRNQLLLGSWWRRLQPSERRQVSENDSPWISILILGTSKNHKVTYLENKETAEADECTSSREIHELAMLCVRTLCDEGRRIKSSAFFIRTRITIFLRRSRTSRKYFWFPVASCGTNCLWTTRRELENKDDHCLYFLFVHARFLPVLKLWCVPFLSLSLGFRSYSKNQNSSFVMTRVTKSCCFGPFKHFCRHFVRASGHNFDSHSKFLEQFLYTFFSSSRLA